MFLHLGSDTVVALQDVISINDFKSFRSSVNREFIQKMRAKKKVIDVSDNQPKSLIVTKYKIYLSAISSVTLKKRADTVFDNDGAF